VVNLFPSAGGIKSMDALQRPLLDGRVGHHPAAASICVQPRRRDPRCARFRPDRAVPCGRAPLTRSQAFVETALRLAPAPPRRAGAQNPENAVDRAPLAIDRWTAFSPIGEQWIENAPLLVSQIAPTQCCLQGSLESKLDSSVKNRQHGLAHS
jgi:hypothetical protein